MQAECLFVSPVVRGGARSDASRGDTDVSPVNNEIRTLKTLAKQCWDWGV